MCSISGNFKQKLGQKTGTVHIKLGYIKLAASATQAAKPKILVKCQIYERNLRHVISSWQCSLPLFDLCSKNLAVWHLNIDR